MIKHIKKGSFRNLFYSELAKGPKGFTLIEIVVVVGVLVVMGTMTFLIVNPIESAQKSRDTRRLGDLNAIQSALETTLASNPNTSMGASTSTVYVSVPDTSAICANLGLAALPVGWQYGCVTATNLQKTDGTGWIPVNFDGLAAKSPLALLPVDPSNRASNRSYYTYIAQGGLTAKLESQKVILEAGAKDGGIDSTVYEVGKNPNPVAATIAPIVVTNAATLVAQTTVTLNGSINPNGIATNGWFRYSTTNPGGCNDSFGTTTSPVQNIGNGVVSAAYAKSVTGLSPLTSYYYCGIGQNIGGMAFGSIQNFTTLGNIWVKRVPSGANPVIRYSHSAVWDNARNKMYVFGGEKDTTAFGVPLNDLWSYNITANSWTQLAPSGTPPSARSGHSAVWDNTRSKMYMFGGFRKNVPTSMNDLWSYDAVANSWTQLTPSGTAPVGRYAHSAVWDAAGDKMYVFGGYSNTTGMYYNEIWVYSATANSWTKIVPPGLVRPSIAYHVAVWDASRSRMYTFGGYNGVSYFNDFWTYNVGTNAWASIAPTGTAPSIRYAHSAAWDASSDKMFVFGGGYGSTYYNDLRSYNAATNAWASVTPSGTAPVARDMHSAIWNAAENRMLVFGGYNNGNWYNDVWEFTR